MAFVHLSEHGRVTVVRFLLNRLGEVALHGVEEGCYLCLKLWIGPTGWLRWKDCSILWVYDISVYVIYVLITSLPVFFWIFLGRISAKRRVGHDPRKER